MSRPLPDRLELAAPGAAAAGARVLLHLPAPLKARALQSAFDRARDAFNRGDVEAVTALFAADVVYVPPPPLHDGPPITGRASVIAFWDEALREWPQSTIENLALEEAAPGRIVRRARLAHRAAGGRALDYEIVQTTWLRAGRVVRQENALAGT